MVAVLWVWGAGGLADGRLANPSPIPMFLRGHQGWHKVSHAALWHGSAQVIVPSPCARLGPFALRASP